jgi:Xaa-Pro dipeptidase
MLTRETLGAFQAALTELGVDGWLLYDFRECNPIARAMPPLEPGMLSRRWFVLVPRDGVPVAVTHAIEQGPWAAWPQEWGREVYSSWRSLETLLGRLVGGRTLAMEYSPGDAVMYLDRIPAGVLEMVRAAGATVVSSGELVSRFYAAWTPAHLASHRRAAEIIARIAHETIAAAGAAARSSSPMTEYEGATRIMRAFEQEGLLSHDVPIVAVGPNAANPHYEPVPHGSLPIREGDMLLVDLWAREPENPYADQTWMASIGTPSDHLVQVFTAVRDARDAAITLLRDRIAAGETVRGAEADDAARAVITARGFGERFVHRTGHSIDPRALHGAGPHLDNLETREERRLVPGVAFSIEPGIYLTGDIGVRLEVNAYVAERELVVTPVEVQRDLIVA